MATKAFTVDLNKPLVSQVGHLGEAYDEWVHQAIISKESPRFFANSFLEHMTRTRWWMIPLVWIPVVMWAARTSAVMGLPLHEIGAALTFGIFMWTLLEYTLHRFVFHIKTTTYWANTMHYLLHGCHHKHPMDGLRLVFPPSATAILVVPFWCIIKLLAAPSVAPALLGGLLLGYTIYDCTHYYLHHGKPNNGLSHYLKRYHMNHHYKLQTKGFGITSSFWDIVFGTLPPPPKSDEKTR